MAAGSLHLTRNVSVFGGYRWWRYRENIRIASVIDDLVIEGPTFGIQGRFWLARHGRRRARAGQVRLRRRGPT